MITPGYWAILQPHKDLELMIAVVDGHVTRICYIRNKAQQVEQLETERPTIQWKESPKEKTIRLASFQIIEFFKKKRKTFDLPLELNGTDFQKLVWKGLMKVPFGDLLSYGDLAIFVDKPRAARAVGTAMSLCEHLIVVPCHRVISGDGSIGGFGDALHVKRILLQIEGHKF